VQTDPAMNSVTEFKKGETIFAEDAPCDGVYVVVEGLVSIQKVEDNTCIELARIAKGGMFGEMAAIDLLQRSASAVAMEETQIVHITSEEFNDRLRALPFWTQLLIQLLVKRLRDADGRIASETLHKRRDINVYAGLDQGELMQMVSKEMLNADFQV
jgi:CRP/FNR family cyclic AMP-dependent transcriptional regulator